MDFSDLSEKRKKLLGVTGIILVLGSWIIIPAVAGLLGYSSIDFAFWLTVFYAVVLLAFRQWKRMGED